ncbi:G patch domain-containing protein 3-like [Gigantopelta aegis]|uniref:G patch domain-containing protein 3-like n=1 Tax=Gigantopelta aegis TaxID=1735272 RepID=UPI001B88AFF1|nr:G patch domain-containing protein 3-like [Gigantopelta aegis]
MATEEGSREITHAIINNIPEIYHSADLRNYFSQFIESGKFKCFHYRHRPETQIAQNNTINPPVKKTFCCVIKLDELHLKSLMKLYHRKHWLDKKGDSISSYCCITKIRVSSNDSVSDSFKTRDEQKTVPPDRQEFTEKDLLTLQELHPPDVMPNGNVGTPTLVFLNFIKQCRLPSSVIRKLGLSFPKTRSQRKYGNVPFDYGADIEYVDSSEEVEHFATTGSGHLIDTAAVSDDDHNDEGGQGSVTDTNTKNCKQRNSYDSKTADGENSGENSVVNTKKARLKRKRDKKHTRKLMAENIEEKLIKLQYTAQTGNDNDTCEEWERHEAVDSDPANQERNKERLFEEDIELKWEKGGSGLVFYTDAQYWHQQEGDFDEQTADDLNVDMSGYYEDGAGDKDARDYLTLRQEQRRRDGTEDTDRFSAGIGKFEKHTKGIGRKILEHQGWREGEGLGTTVTGIADALGNEGQHPRDKKGFGYRGKKLARYVRKAAQKRADEGGIITSIYDNPDETDPTETLLRRNNPYGLKYRNNSKYKTQS